MIKGFVGHFIPIFLGYEENQNCKKRFNGCEVDYKMIII